MEKWVVEIVLFIALLIICIWRITNRREENQTADMQPPMFLDRMEKVVGRVSNMQTGSLSGANKSVYITLTYDLEYVEGEYINAKEITFILTDYNRYSFPLIGRMVKVFFAGPGIEHHAIPHERVIQYIAPVDSEEK